MPLQSFWLPAMFWVAILTMTVPNVIALLQRDVKRILGYSSIANAGYVLVGLLAHLSSPAKISLTSTLFFLLSYVLMTVGAFAVITLNASNGREGTALADLRGLWRRSPFAAGALIVFCLSLIGIPPTAGFFGKLWIFSDALGAGLTPLAIVLAVNSAISVYYYSAIIMNVFVAEEGARTPPLARLNFGVVSTCVICLAGIFGSVIFMSPLLSWLGAR
jgi:NADH-quinone oxidoreductase subunit N